MMTVMKKMIMGLFLSQFSFKPISNKLYYERKTRQRLFYLLMHPTA